jgi:hypothetical protein
MYKSLPNNIKTIHIDVEGETTGIRYEGSFGVKCALSIRDKQAVEVSKSRLTEDMANPSNSLYAMAAMISILRAKIMDFPEWWKEVNYGSDLLDDNVLIELFEKCEQASEDWRKSLKPKEESKEEVTDNQGNDPKGK